jgi:hypothetical protein
MYVLPVVLLHILPLVSILGQYLQLFVVQILLGLMEVLEEEGVLFSSLVGWVLILERTKVSRRFFGLLLPTMIV